MGIFTASAILLNRLSAISAYAMFKQNEYSSQTSNCRRGGYQPTRTPVKKIPPCTVTLLFAKTMLLSCFISRVYGLHDKRGCKTTVFLEISRLSRIGLFTLQSN